MLECQKGISGCHDAGHAEQAMVRGSADDGRVRVGTADKGSARRRRNVHLLGINYRGRAKDK
jgi:hypothetical protein